MIKKLCIIMMIMTLSSIQLLDVQANPSILSQLPEAIQERLYDRLNNQGDDTITETKLTASDGATYDRFGFDVAIDGSTLVVGAQFDDDRGSDSGSVYVYDLTKATSDAGFERKITASDGAASDYFGRAVAIDGSTVVVGAYADDDNGNASGSVYVYDLTKATSDAGFERKITASDGAAGDFFGYAVAIDGSTVVVGAYLDIINRSASGSVYVYDLTKATSDAGFETKITASDGAAGDYFGFDVAIDGSTLVVGAYGDDDRGSDSGSVYVYDLTKATSDAGFETKITASDGAAYDHFSLDVAIEGSTLVVGSHWNDYNVNVIDSGSVYVYDLTKATSDAGFERKITASDGATGVNFGWKVAIDGSTLVVGAIYDNDNGSYSGSVYLYNGTFGSGTTKTDEEWASEITAMIDALTTPYDINAVEAAREAYNNLTVDQQALVTNYQTLLDAEVEVADQVAAASVDAMIDALTTPYDINAVEASREAYNNLTIDQQALVTNYQALLDAESEVADQVAAASVDAMIDALTSPYDINAVEAAREAYDALTTTQQALVTNTQVLLDAEAEVADQVAAAAVDAMIDALTSPYDRNAVEDAREAYDALTTTQQALVTGLPDLEAAEAGLIDQAIARAVDLLIDTLTVPYDRNAVEDARDAYDALTETQQALVTGLSDLEAAEQALIDIDAAAAVDAMIDALSEPYDRNAVEAAREAYNNLTESQQALVTGLPDLETAEQALADIAAAAEVDAMIDLLISPYVATDVKDAREAYDNLTEDQQALVTGRTQLEIAEAGLNDQLNAQAAAEVDALIQTLSEEATEEDVEAAREAYDALTPEQQALVTELPTLETYERQIEPNFIVGNLLIILIVIAGISAVIYFGFYKKQKEEPKIEQKKAEPKTSNQEHPKDNFVSRAFIEKELIALRERLQQKYDYAEFFIYSDEQLDLLIEHQPKTKAEFIKVKGFGEKKYKNFGKEVIQLFKTYKLK